MNRRLLATLALSTAMCSAGCDDAEQVQAGPELLQPFKMELKQALKSGLEGGAVRAIEVCRVKAPEIAAALSRDGVRMGRASHKLRNPGNKGPDWVQPVLDAYLQAGATPQPQTITIADGYEGYVEPILTQPLCLVCHGESLAPDLEAKLSELYPDDRAQGFSTGELRGVFWVEYPASR